MKRNVKIAGLAKYLPKKIVKSEELDFKLDLPKGTLEHKTGVKERHFASPEENETAITMGAIAVKRACENAGIALSDIDLLVSASGCTHRPIPCNAALIHRELGLDTTNVGAFDINSTCLSFLTSLDLLSYPIQAGKYKNVVVVSSEIASVGLNWNQLESAALFGDGAAACVISPTPKGEESGIINSVFKTYSVGADSCRIEGGGNGLPAYLFKEEDRAKYLFHMDGRAVFGLVSRHLLEIVEELFAPVGLSMKDMNLVIPHQASLSALRLVQKKLEVEDERYMRIVQDHGNTIAASLPMGIYEAYTQGRLKRGDKIFLLGTSAGLSINSMILQF